jgi:hypothetical protein
LRQARRGDEVLARLALLQLGEQLARLVLVAGVAAEREQRVGREGDEAVQRQPARDVLDVRVQAAVLVHHQHQRQRAGGLRRPHQVAARLAVALGGIEVQPLGLDARVGRRHHLRRGELRAQRRQQAGRSGAAPAAWRAAPSRKPRRSMRPCTYWSNRRSTDSDVSSDA